MKRSLIVAVLRAVAVLFLVGWSSGAALANTQAVFYVSPAGTGTACSSSSPCAITQAQAIVRTINGNMTGDIIVYLIGGSYNFSGGPFTVGTQDSGTNGYNVIYQAISGETPFFEGGFTIPSGSWTLHDSHLNIYQARVAPNLDFRQIYVNGKRAVRARAPNMTNPLTKEPYYTALTSVSPFQVQASEVYRWPNMDRVGAPEFVFLAHWNHKRARLAGYAVDGDTATLTFMDPENSDSILNVANQTPTPFYFENAYQLLDAPGEWFLNRSSGSVISRTAQLHALYYIPRPGEDMSTAVVTVPVATSVLLIQGTSSLQLAHNLTFRGITFQDTNWILPNTLGYLCLQAAVTVDDSTTNVPGAVYLKNVQNITLENNVFQHTGAHGVLIQGSNNVQVLNNTFTDLSAGGAYIDGYDAGLTDQNDLISNNLVDSYGESYDDAVGILATRGVSNTSIQHNEVRFGRYTGISFGWEWTGILTGTNNDSVQNNLIHDVMELHDDGAGIYTLGNMPSSTFQNNYVHTLTPSAVNGGNPIAGIYLDNGSKNKLVQDNVLDTTVEEFHACNPPNGPNVLNYNYYNVLAGCVGSGNILMNNIFVNGSNWPAAAQAIMAGAGIQ